MIDPAGVGALGRSGAKTDDSGIVVALRELIATQRDAMVREPWRILGPQGWLDALGDVIREGDTWEDRGYSAPQAASGPSESDPTCSCHAALTGVHAVGCALRLRVLAPPEEQALDESEPWFVNLNLGVRHLITQQASRSGRGHLIAAIDEAIRRLRAAMDHPPPASDAPERDTQQDSGSEPSVERIAQMAVQTLCERLAASSQALRGLAQENKTLNVMLPPLHAKIAELKAQLASPRASAAPEQPVFSERKMFTPRDLDRIAKDGRAEIARKVRQLPTFGVKVYQNIQDVYGRMIVTVELDDVLAALSSPSPAPTGAK